MEAQNIIVVDKFDGKFLINNAYRPIAEALVDKYPELSHVAVDSILFVEDLESTKKNKGHQIFAQIGAMQEKWSDIMYQTTGQHFDYMMEIYKINIINMSREQIVALIYHELRHIGRDGKIVDHDINDWINMIEKLGVNWNTTRAGIPNLLSEGIDWDSIEGPATLFPAESTIKLVK